jgi:curli biogenesis system outer membrane secretion channel CsgG
MKYSALVAALLALALTACGEKAAQSTTAAPAAAMAPAAAPDAASAPVVAEASAPAATDTMMMKK